MSFICIAQARPYSFASSFLGGGPLGTITQVPAHRRILSFSASVSEALQAASETLLISTAPEALSVASELFPDASEALPAASEALPASSETLSISAAPLNYPITYMSFNFIETSGAEGTITM